MGVRPGVDVYLPGPLPHAATKRSPTTFCVIVSMARGPYGHLFSKETILFAREKRQANATVYRIRGRYHSLHGLHDTKTSVGGQGAVYYGISCLTGWDA